MIASLASPLRHRLPVPVAVVLGLAIFGAVFGAGYWLTEAPPPMPGTELDGTPAPDFKLEDYRGLPFALGDVRGKPVALAFMYSQCADVCRLTAAGLKEAADALGADAGKVAFVAVSVDPGGDQPGMVRRFLGSYKLTNQLTYLTGPAEALPNVWHSYFLFVDPGELGAHTDALFLIDKQGRERALLRSDFDPTEVAAALRQLAAERL